MDDKFDVNDLLRELSAADDDESGSEAAPAASGEVEEEEEEEEEEEVEESAVASASGGDASRRTSAVESLARQRSGSGASSGALSASGRRPSDQRAALLAGLGLEESGHSDSGSDSEVAVPFQAASPAALDPGVAALAARPPAVSNASEAATQVASLRRHATMLDLEEDEPSSEPPAASPTIEAVPAPTPVARRSEAGEASEAGRLRHATMMDLDQVDEVAPATCLTTPSASEAPEVLSRRNSSVLPDSHEIAKGMEAQLVARSATSSERDFLPGAESVPPTPLALGSKGGGLNLSLPSPATRAVGTPVSGHVRAHQRLSPRCSPRLAQSAFSAQQAAGLVTPRGSKHEDSGLWIPAARGYEGLAATSDHRLHKDWKLGYVDLCEGTGPGLAPNLGGAEGLLSLPVDSPREKHVPATSLTAERRAATDKAGPRLTKLHRPPRPQRSTWPPVVVQDSTAFTASRPRAARLSGRGAPRVRPPSHGVGQDSPLPEVSPKDIVLEERCRVGQSSPPVSAVKAPALGGLAATTRQKVLMLREQVGALAAYCDRLEHAAGLAQWHGNGLLPLGPAHTAAMKQAAQQLSIWADAADGTAGTVDTDRTPTATISPRKDMASWLADLTKTSRSADVSLSEPSVHGFGPDDGAGPADDHKIGSTTTPRRSFPWDLGTYLWPEELSSFTTPPGRAHCSTTSPWVQTPAC